MRSRSVVESASLVVRSSPALRFPSVTAIPLPAFGRTGLHIPTDLPGGRCIMSYDTAGVRLPRQLHVRQGSPEHDCEAVQCRIREGSAPSDPLSRSMARPTRYRSTLNINQFALGALAWLAVLGGGPGGCGPSPSEPTGAGGSAGRAGAGVGGGGLAGASGGGGGPSTGNGGGGGSASGGSFGTGGFASGGCRREWGLCFGRMARGWGGRRRNGRGAARTAAGRAAGRAAAGPALADRQRQQAAGPDGQDDHPARLRADRHRRALRVRRQERRRDHGPHGQDRGRRRAGARRPAARLSRDRLQPGRRCHLLPLPLSGRHRPDRGLHAEIAAVGRRLRRQGAEAGVDYATSKNLYVIIDYHQIDNATTGTSAADAKTFWTDIAPKFAGASNVLYEPFNEPIDTNVRWSALKPVVQQLIDTIRAGAPKNIIIVPSNTWDQHPGDAASDPPSGTNLMYTAHITPQTGAPPSRARSRPRRPRHRCSSANGDTASSESAVVRNVLADHRQRRRRQLDRLGHRQRLDAQHLRRHQPDHADQLRHAGEELAGGDGEQRLGSVARRRRRLRATRRANSRRCRAILPFVQRMARPTRYRANINELALGTLAWLAVLGAGSGGCGSSDRRTDRRWRIRRKRNGGRQRRWSRRRERGQRDAHRRQWTAAALLRADPSGLAAATAAPVREERARHRGRR